MSELIKNKYSLLQILYWTTLLLGVVLFFFTTYLKLREILHGATSNVLLERYGIILTLAGIPGALKIYHVLVSRIAKQLNERNMNRYVFSYILRLAILEFVIIFNSIALFLTGSRSFFLMIFITLVSFLFCMPNKKEFFSLYNRGNNPIEEK